MLAAAYLLAMLTPWATAQALQPMVVHQLGEARRVALSRMDKLPTCAGLFAHLDAGGTETLARLRFRRPVHPVELAKCETAGALAYPRVPTVVVCHGFDGRGRAAAAAALIHEALHVAGLGEAPAVAGAPTSAEITAQVVTACRLNRAGNLE